MEHRSGSGSAEGAAAPFLFHRLFPEGGWTSILFIPLCLPASTFCGLMLALFRWQNPLVFRFSHPLNF
ncbi:MULTISPECIES: hypothetical protein [Rhizobium]|uniref:Uncharacterized protein n=1 Tax=Rhizobium miluonense TaxID=411945 RepID=A0A1C3X6B5_9HYPH|nr:hypothetical protein [Rhizobium miluonense]SCB47767.1 hypothetical protein GA0061102_10613 [Rhizobium miluonense]